MISLRPLVKIWLRRVAGRVAFTLRPSTSGERAIRVLMYHDISNEYVPGEWEQSTTPTTLFAAQMRWLREAGYRVIDGYEAVEMLSGRCPWPAEPLAVLTFDDGLRSYVRNAWPVLEHLRFPSTLFVATGFVGRDRRYLNWGEVQQLRRSGLVTCGSHTVSHTKLRGLPAERVRRELRESKQVMEDHLQRPVTLLAYPYGSYDTFDESTIAGLKAEGFVGAFTTIAGTNPAGTECFRLRRTRISWVDQLPEFQMTMAGAFDWYAGYQWALSR